LFDSKWVTARSSATLRNLPFVSREKNVAMRLGTFGNAPPAWMLGIWEKSVKALVVSTSKEASRRQCIMAHYFTREEAEALLPQITTVLSEIQEGHKSLLRTQEELDILRMQAAGNGYHLHERMMTLQGEIPRQAQSLRNLLNELAGFGCILKDPEQGLIDFLSTRNGREIYLCWYLGEERINFWHYTDEGFAGRHPL